MKSTYKVHRCWFLGSVVQDNLVAGHRHLKRCCGRSNLCSRWKGKGIDGAGFLHLLGRLVDTFIKGFTVLDGDGENPELLLWWSGWLEQLAS
jgi:hypothetical protein